MKRIGRTSASFLRRGNETRVNNRERPGSPGGVKAQFVSKTESSVSEIFVKRNFCHRKSNKGSMEG